jgi:predicted RNA-binding Zn-ribbon protein involved in translation (DUF1610 family)
MIDGSALFAPLVNQLVTHWWLPVLILMVLFLKTPFAKGLLGELLVNIAIYIRLDKNLYHLMNNVTLPTEDGSTQIDHVLVSQYGVFVIETKNMSGWIFGSEHQKVWTQNIYKQKHKFQNPLHQNYKHAKTIESILGLDGEKVFSVVVFVGDSTFKTEMPQNVTYASGLFRYINLKTKIILSQKEVESIIAAIESGGLSKTFKTHREHVKHVKENVVNKSFSRDTNCPRCGNTLVLRTAKTGANASNDFYGCSTYPKCRYTKNS